MLSPVNFDMIHHSYRFKRVFIFDDLHFPNDQQKAHRMTMTDKLFLMDYVDMRQKPVLLYHYMIDLYYNL